MLEQQIILVRPFRRVGVGHKRVKHLNGFMYIRQK
jgi:hypothetical protein